MRLFVTRVPAPNAMRDNGTKWQIVIENDDGHREEENPERVTLLGTWEFGHEEGGTPTIWLKPGHNGAFLLG